MKITYSNIIIQNGPFINSYEWTDTYSYVEKMIREMEYPEGSGHFYIYPESGKKHGMGNGVKPIKEILMSNLDETWRREVSFNSELDYRIGKIDAVRNLNDAKIALEWETGNISSSHRAVNKMCLLMIQNLIHAGILILPVKNFAQYLTDRIGNYEELSSYFILWSKIPVPNGVLCILGIEHDATSFDVPRFLKGTDGRANH